MARECHPGVRHYYNDNDLKSLLLHEQSFPYHPIYSCRMEGNVFNFQQIHPLSPKCRRKNHRDEKNPFKGIPYLIFKHIYKGEYDDVDPDRDYPVKGRFGCSTADNHPNMVTCVYAEANSEEDVCLYPDKEQSDGR
ncbi:unnamed protein product [Cylicocyclus nassatus]|uniref:Uncharacterized protein n=1 Tax=Cylicocyclus nassatus TaxID=53992 RepID=A0AA36GDY7_CYLNA|nr:unnamed protein product [Cylicocyclus nassatus]